MIALIMTLMLSQAKAEWVVPPTGIVVYPGMEVNTMPTFNVPKPSTVNYPLPDWSQPKTETKPTQDYNTFSMDN